MQRSALRVEKEKSEEERQRDIDDEHWVLDLPETKQKESKYVFDPSYTSVEQLCYGRMSFNGFNVEVEKLMKLHNASAELEAAEEREREISVPDKEMANRYKSLIGTIGKKFAKKRQRSEIKDMDDGKVTIDLTQDNVPMKKKKNKEKPKFLKPAD
ncbi:hypothetical protein FSP39_024860 [Pinctada imbricata]|uniref:M-phase phosphoprotein 6 n=1 Tax=Pinctada imbricata TaxID=66713 RepID=A0AA89BUC1_PINIB|nr:hypothetical protein FSP39_024860 [Pinctada imbricata]